jgi:hypothetical protein
LKYVPGVVKTFSLMNVSNTCFEISSGDIESILGCESIFSRTQRNIPPEGLGISIVSGGQWVWRALIKCRARSLYVSE